MNNRDDLIYLAPMEGITGYIYRNAHHKYCLLYTSDAADD